MSNVNSAVLLEGAERMILGYEEFPQVSPGDLVRVDGEIFEVVDIMQTYGDEERWEFICNLYESVQERKPVKITEWYRRVRERMADCIRGRDKCPHLHRSSTKGETLPTAKGKDKVLDQFCFYCRVSPGVRKIGSIASWAGATPKWCPLNQEEEKK